MLDVMLKICFVSRHGWLPVVKSLNDLKPCILKSVREAATPTEQVHNFHNVPPHLDHMRLTTFEGHNGAAKPYKLTGIVATHLAILLLVLCKVSGTSVLAIVDDLVA